MGWGQVGQHRKHGAKGGYGKAGLHKHKWSWVVKYQPDYFGSHGFYNPTVSRAEKWLNVGQLEEIAVKHAADGNLDLHSLGYDKLLGEGEIKVPLTVRVARYSQRAKEKVEKAGGKVIPVEGV